MGLKTVLYPNYLWLGFFFSSQLFLARLFLIHGSFGLGLFLFFFHPNYFCFGFVFLPVSEQQERAFTLGLAGLLGEGVYNFGELVSAATSLHAWSPGSCFSLLTEPCVSPAADAPRAGVPAQHRPTVAH